MKTIKTKSSIFGMVPFAVAMVLCFCLVSINLFGQYVGPRTEKDGFKWVRVSQNGIEGAKSMEGDWIIPIDRGYSRIVYQKSGGGWFNVFVNGFVQGGVCDKTGKEIIVPKYVVMHESDGFRYYTVELNGKKGVYDMDGNEVIAPKYESVIYIHGAFKYENASGEWVSTGIKAKQKKDTYLASTTTLSVDKADAGEIISKNPLGKDEKETEVEENINMVTLTESGENFVQMENNYVTPTYTAEKNDSPNAKRGTGGLAMALGGTNLFARKPEIWSYVFTVNIESGSFISSTPLFYDSGVGLYFNGLSRRLSYSTTSDASSWGMRIPAHFGWYAFGNEEDLHLTLRAGIYTNFLFNSKMDKQSLKVKFKDRFGFDGGVRATLGYKLFCISAEYLFPIKGSGDGAFMFGITLGH